MEAVVPRRNWHGLLLIATVSLVLVTASGKADASTPSLAVALNATNLVWRTGGHQPWQGQTAVSRDGLHAAQSGAITHDQESWLESTVTGPGDLTFWWRVSSEAGYDDLEFLINDTEVRSLSGDTGWLQESFSLPAGSHLLRWRYVKDDSVSDGQDRGWVDLVNYTRPTESAPVILRQPPSQSVGAGDEARFTVEVSGFPAPAYQWFFNGEALTGGTNPVLSLARLTLANAGSYTVWVSNALGGVLSQPALLTVVPLETALDTTSLDWLSGGHAPWFWQTLVSSDGADAARSGRLTNHQESWFQTSLTGPGTLSFWWKVSSETNFDTLVFLLNETPLAGISGEVDWRQETVSLPPGPHTARWRYAKDDSLSLGQDAGWVDLVEFLPSPPQPFQLSLPSRLPDGSMQFTLAGEAGRTYVIEASADLRTWSDLTNLTASGTLSPIRDIEAATLRHRFYRVRLPP